MTIEQEIEEIKKSFTGVYVAEWNREQKNPHVHLFSEKINRMRENPYNELDWPMFCMGSWEECTNAIENLPEELK